MGKRVGTVEEDNLFPARRGTKYFLLDMQSLKYL